MAGRALSSRSLCYRHHDRTSAGTHQSGQGTAWRVHLSATRPLFPGAHGELPLNVEGIGDVYLPFVGRRTSAIDLLSTKVPQNLSPSRTAAAITHPAQSRTRGPHLLRGLRVWRHQFQVILLQEQTDDHTHLMQRQVHAGAFVQAAAEPDEGKRVLTVFDASRGKAPWIIARWLLEHFRQLVGELGAEGSQPALGHTVPAKLIRF